MDFKHIVHIADLHIGSGNRSAEYRKVFDKLSEQIDKIGENIDNTLIVIAGDVFHHKTRYSGEDVADFNYLLSVLQLYQIVLIPGNHDTNLYDATRMDLLTPLCGSHPNLHYYKYSGEYNLRNLKFYHVSVFSNDTASDIESLINTENPTLTKDTILLYHGLITGAKLDKHTVGNQRITRKVLDAVKLTIAGDVHHHQFITPTCAYSGSLIQQNVAESINKGFLHWNLNLDSNLPTFIPIENDCGFIRIDLRGKTETEVDTIIKSTPQLQQIHKVRLLTDAVDTTYNEQVRKINDTIGRIDSVSISSPDLSVVNPTEDIRTSLNALLTTAGADELTRNELVESHCSKVCIQQTTKWSVLELHWGNLFKYGTGNCIDFSQLTDISGVIANNMAGKSSIIDILVFGLYGEHLRADNKSMVRNGTTTSYVRVKFIVSRDIYIIERNDDKKHVKLRLYKLETNKLENNNQLTNITAVSNDATYRLVKNLIGSLDTFQTTGLYYDPNLDIVKMKNNARMTILPELFGMTDNETIIIETKNKIKFIKQQIDKLVKPRAVVNPTLLRDNNMLQLDDINNKLTKINIEIADLQVTIDKCKTYLNITRMPEVISAGISQLDQELKETRVALDSMGLPTETPYSPVATIDEKTIRIASAIIKDANGCAISEEEISRRINMIGIKPAGNCDLINSQIKQMTTNIENYTVEKNKLVITINSNDILILQKQLAATNVDLNLQKLLPTDTKLIDALTLQYNKLTTESNLKFAVACDCCTTNKKHLAADLVQVELQLGDEKAKIQNNIEANDITLTKITQLKLKQSEITTEINATIELNNIANRNDKLTHLIASESAALDKLKISVAEIDKFNKRSDELPALLQKRNQYVLVATAKKQVDAYNNYIAYTKWNEYNTKRGNIKTLNEKITQLKQELISATDYNSISSMLQITTTKYTELLQQATNYNILIGALNSKLDDINAEIAIYTEYNDKFPALSSELNKYKMYVDCLGNAGLRMMIIKRNIDKLIAAVNSILALVCNFKLSYELTDTAIGFNIIEPNNTPPLSLGSGFQKFIISIAMRLALTSILPTSCQFIIIDEGFGCMDSQNIESVAKLFSHIAGKFKFTFIISHREQLQPIITQPLYITETPNGSFVTPHEELAVATDIMPLVATGETNNTVKDADIPIDSFLCACGAIVKKASRAAHCKTAKHLKNIK